MMNLSPVRSEWGFRVPLFRDGDTHIMFVGDNHRRIFTADTLPADIKLKLAMIIVSAYAEPLISEDAPEESFRLTLYMMVPRVGFENIGWRLSEHYFMIVMSEDELEELKGDTGS